MWVIVQWFVVLQRYDVSGWCSQAAGSHWAMVRWEMMIFFVFVFTLEAICIFFFFFWTKQYKEQKMVWGRIYEGWVWFVVRLGIFFRDMVSVNVLAHIVLSVSDACMPSARRWCLNLYVGRRCPGLYSVCCASLGVCMWLLMFSSVMRLLISVTALIRFVCMLS